MKNDNPMTAAKVAAHLGLSKATVTHVLSGRATKLRIRQDTQQRVLDAVRDLGYRPNLSARATRTGQFGCAALIQSLKALYLPTELLQGIVETLAEYDMHLSVAEVPDEVIDNESYVPKAVRALTADGLLINRILDIPAAFIERIHALRTPAIFLNVKQESDCVHPDDLSGGKIATEHLLNLGHIRIAYVQADVHEKEHYSEFDRRFSYDAAMRTAGLTPRYFRLPANPLTSEDLLAENRINIARELLMAPDRPTGLITYELTEAMAIYHAANQLGIRIPDDLSLITFHWGIDPRFCVPLTTVTNSMRQVGREAVRMLVSKTGAPTLPLPARVVPVELLEGRTCTRFR